MNAEICLNINNNGETKMQELVECAADGSKTYDEIIDEWNEEWTSAQESCGVEIQ